MSLRFPKSASKTIMLEISQELLEKAGYGTWYFERDVSLERAT